MVSIGWTPTGQSPLLWLWLKILGALAAFAAIIQLARRRKYSFFADLLDVRAVAFFTTGWHCWHLPWLAWAAIQWPDAHRCRTEAPRSLRCRKGREIPWQDVHRNPARRRGAERPRSPECTDRDFLDILRQRSAVQDAISRVKKMMDADLAYAALTQNSPRGLKSLAEMMNRQDVRLVPFGDHTSITTPDKKDLGTALRGVLKDPAELNTDIAGALQFVTEQSW